MQQYITVEDAAGNPRKVPVNQFLSVAGGGGGVSKSRVRKIVRQNQVFAPVLTQTQQPLAVSASENLVLRGVDLVGKTYTFRLQLQEPSGIGPIAPTVVSYSVTAAPTADDTDSITVVLDTTLSSGGDYVLKVTNNEGCCSVVPFGVAGG